MKNKALFIVLALFILLFSACTGNADVTTGNSLTVDYSNFRISDYITLGNYKNLTVDKGTLAADVALWTAIEENSTVKKYPSGEVNYYYSNLVAEYKYYASVNSISYEKALEVKGLKDEDLLNEAKKMVRSDLVFYAVANAEKIVLTAEEKTANFDRYAQKIADDYGYTAEYVKENLSDSITELMLYDKVTEYLLTLNSVN